MGPPLKEVELGAAARDYIVATLSRGLILARLTLERLDLDRGGFVTVVPGDASAERAGQFDMGGLVQGAVITEYVAQRIVNHQHLAGDVFIAENALARCADPEHPADPPQRFCVGDGVFEYADCAQSTDVLRAISMADAGFSLNGFVTAKQSSRVRLPTHRRQASKRLLGELASATNLILVRAYDGEGFVLWERR